MTDNSTAVRPGNIISSSFINAILQRLDDLDQRVQKIEGISPPSITVVTPLGAPEEENMVVINLEAVIRGTNFAASAADNKVEFIVIAAGQQVIYPKEGEEPLPVAVNSSSEIQVLVPDIQEVTGNLSRAVRLRLTVTGNDTPAIKDIRARRGTG